MKEKLVENVYVRNLNIEPVAKPEEIKLFLNLFEDSDPIKLSICNVIFGGFRPVEVPKLKWSWLEIQNNEVKSIGRMVYKPRRVMNKESISTFYKAIKVPCFSKYLSDLFIEWKKISPNYEMDKIFGFNKTDSMQKKIQELRNCINSDRKWKIKKTIEFKRNKGGKFVINPRDYITLGKEYDFVNEKCLENLNDCKNQPPHRFSLYSMRRFALSFYFWTIFLEKAKGSQEGAAILMCKEYSAHSRPDTLLNHYIMSYKSIGLKKEEIGKYKNIDEHIGLKIKGQTKIYEFLKNQIEFGEFTSENQTKLTTF